ncbi:basic salivary proline-rich protein 2-like [Formica exsecta]|uniref:basic salivary proline-rich protein 2-like n=1 Tax=Formica exsecta TaxID=72781 RepID=UPI0011427BCC|nr:basic salivary proline-rich protein 2-like [Formica exsecta]
MPTETERRQLEELFGSWSKDEDLPDGPDRRPSHHRGARQPGCPIRPDDPPPAGWNRHSAVRRGPKEKGRSPDDAAATSTGSAPRQRARNPATEAQGDPSDPAHTSRVCSLNGSNRAETPRRRPTTGQRASSTATEDQPDNNPTVPRGRNSPPGSHHGQGRSWNRPPRTTPSGPCLEASPAVDPGRPMDPQVQCRRNATEQQATPNHHPIRRPHRLRGGGG